MIEKKHKEIIKIIKLINKVFGVEAPELSNEWDTFSAIGLQKGDKIIYIAYYSKKDYFYSCDLLVDLSMLYCGTVTSKEELLKVIEKFFEIRKVTT